MTSGRALACQVVPDIASFAVDDGFRYRLPGDHLVSVGSRVRVRVGGRRMRGFVTALFDTLPDRELLDIDGVVGDVPSFDEEHLELLRWCARHYVSPLSTILKRTVPPNAPRRVEQSKPPERPAVEHRVQYLVGPAPHGERVETVVASRLEGSSAMVIAPSIEEVEAIARVLQEAGHHVRVAHSDMTGKALTSAWVAAAADTGTVLVGTREIVLWPVTGLSQVVVVEESRRVMKSPSTPTLGVREVAIERCRRAGVALTFVGPLPSLEVIGRGGEVEAATGRLWPLIEVVDRGEEPPSASPLTERTRQAVAAVVRSGGRVFVLVPRRGYAAAAICRRCSNLRRCPTCGSAAGTETTCVRCGTGLGGCEACGSDRWRPLGAGIGGVTEDLRRSIGDAVGGAEDDRAVVVGTERDLIGVSGLTLAVAVDVDGMALAPNYRAPEDALRTLVRLSQTVARGRGHRCLIQTSDVGQPVVEALRSGRFEGFVESELAMRRRAGFPPFGELLAIEVRDHEDADGEIRRSVGSLATVHGPASMRDRSRWLVTGPRLDPARLALRHAVGAIRDAGGRVRVDADPQDL